MLKRLPLFSYISSRNYLSTNSTKPSLSKVSPNGAFSLSYETANGPIELDFPSAPTSSLLKLSAKSSNGAIRASLNPTYEGKFHAITSNVFRNEVKYNSETEDPAGKGRMRKFDLEKIGAGAQIKGRVWWADSDGGGKQIGDEAGDVEVKTSNANVELNFN